MKLLKGLIPFAAVSLLCLSGTANAEYIDNADYSYINGRAEISGKFFDNSNNTYATLIVLKEGGDINNISDSLVEKQEEVLIKNGSFSFSFPLSSDKSGKYTAYVEAGGKSKVSQFSFCDNIESIFKEITEQTTEEGFCSKTEQYKDELNLSDSVYGKLTDSLAAAKMVYAVKSELKDVETLKGALKAAAYIQALNESKRELVFDEYRFIDDKALGVDALDKDFNVNAYSLFTQQLTENGKTAAIDKVSANGFKSVEEFWKAFIYNCTIAAIKYNKNSGTAHVSEILRTNNSVNGFDLTNYNKASGNSIDLKLINGNEWEKADIQKLLNGSGGTTNDSRGDIGGGSGSGSGTRGGGISSGNYSQDYSVVKKPEQKSFADIDESMSWAKPAIENLCGKGIINGRDENTFAPMDNVTRAEFLKIAVSAFEIKSADAGISFSDVTEDKWYYECVKAAYSLGIVTGYSDTYFGADDNITRQDAAVILQRALKAAGKEIENKAESKDFADGTEISDYAKEAVAALSGAGILNGDDYGSFNPKNNCTRAQAAVMVSNVLEQLEAKEG